jgi:uncharacterized membrane protein
MTPPGRSLAAAALLGVSGGLRTFTPLAALAVRGRLGGARAATVLPVLAGGELVGDKLPIVPPRTSPPALAGRVGSGAVCGVTVAGPAGAVAGALAAAAATFAFTRGRAALGARTGVPDPLLGLCEDVAAIALAAAASRSR